MIKKEVSTKVEGAQFNGKSINAYIEEDQYEDEPITAAIGDSISDFYNLMHLIENSWTNKEYELKMRDAGYDIYDKDERVEGWIGIPEKWDCLVFMLYYCGDMWDNAEKIKKGPITIFDWDEDWWIYSELNLTDISREKIEETQRKIVKAWIDKICGEILHSHSAVKE
jgi:hypothetical protein